MKPKIYKVEDGAFVEIGVQCYQTLTFHHEAYVVGNCNLREGHAGPHHCNNCGKKITLSEEAPNA